MDVSQTDMLYLFLFFYKIYDFFYGRHSLMNRTWYNTLLQFMQHGNFRNLNRVIFNLLKISIDPS